MSIAYSGMGVTRHVFLVGSYAVKFPRVTYGWRAFLRGLLANIDEKRLWDAQDYEDSRRQLRDKLLCPIVWASWGGWILIMRRADVRRHVQEIYNSADIGDMDPAEEVSLRYKVWIDAGFGGDDKCDNYGYLEGRLVKIDYSN